MDSAMKTDAVCPLCSSENLSVIRTKLRNDIRREVLQCDACTIIFLRPDTADSDLPEYYRAEYRAVHNPVVGVETTPQERFDMHLPFQEARIEKIKHILRPDMKVLEIGCSAGHFLKAVSPSVAECVGLEYNASDVEFVRNVLEFPVWSEPLEKTNCPFEYFDMVAMFQVFEHVADPVSFLAQVGRCLKKGGYLVIEVPNINDALLSVYDIPSYAEFYFREPHVFYYSLDTLKRMVKGCGFTGSASTTQRYNVLNHFSWLFTGKPQANSTIAMGAPQLPVKPDTPGLQKALNVTMRGLDEVYREILIAYNRGESIFFIGQKK